jgi:NAD-dependent dihydropyrimidine dehydrogenase PreA subunit
MNLLKTIWSMLFRLFPCPVKVSLCRIGNPDRDSPVLVTCNFYLTVRRLIAQLKGLDIWLLIADSKGVNVWCAAGGEKFNTRSVVSAIKTSGIADQVDHRTVILPPLGAPGIQAKAVKEETGWSVKWGPVRLNDISAYLKNNQQRSEDMQRVTYNWRERLDTAVGPLFPFFLIGAIGFLIFGSHLLINYFAVSTIAFFLFMLTCPWLPGRSGLTKVIVLEILLILIWIVTNIFQIGVGGSMHANLVIAMVMLLVYGSELGGLAATMPSDLDPFLAKLGIGAIGNVEFAGTIRTELLNGVRTLTYYADNCVGCRNCVELCPQGCWSFDSEKHAVLARKEKCTACRACIVQCEGQAIKAEKYRSDLK